MSITFISIHLSIKYIEESFGLMGNKIGFIDINFVFVDLAFNVIGKALGSVGIEDIFIEDAFEVVNMRSRVIGKTFSLVDTSIGLMKKAICSIRKRNDTQK
jgi:hypothetical protein